MTFSLVAIGVFTAAALVYALIIRPGGRGWALLVGSIVAVYWLQPSLPIRFSDFILPTITILLTVVGWWSTRRPEDPEQKLTVSQDRLAILVTLLIILALSLFRYVGADYRITASRPPSPLIVLLALAVFAGLLLLVYKVLNSYLQREDGQRKILTGLIIFVVILFIIVKSEPLATAASGLWRRYTGQDANLASPSNLAWLGFSFVAFRLIHTFRDRQTGLMPILSYKEYLTYVIFFPSYTAGPIDRAERFAAEMRSLPEMVGLDAGRFVSGFSRIIIGLFKKFVVADTLARGLSLTAENAAQSESSFWLWILLYGYGFRLFFDFAGYTDIAIGIGILFGVKLPENFDRPYLKSNITAFWQSWHITLSNWVRFYIFTPLSRSLLRKSWRPSNTVIVLIAQLTTMAVIGLWHGITWNFFIWGIWHGLGLFVHKVWSDRTRGWHRSLGNHPGQKRAWTFFSWFLTFNFVILGWVWFALPTITLSLDTFAHLFGFGW